MKKMETELLLNIMENLANGNIPGVVAAIAVVVFAMIYQFKELRKKSEETHKEIKKSIKELGDVFEQKIEKLETKNMKEHEKVEAKLDKVNEDIKEINKSLYQIKEDIILNQRNVKEDRKIYA
jgi:gas vesicle protein